MFPYASSSSPPPWVLASPPLPPPLPTSSSNPTSPATPIPPNSPSLPLQALSPSVKMAGTPIGSTLSQTRSRAQPPRTISPERSRRQSTATSGGRGTKTVIGFAPRPLGVPLDHSPPAALARTPSDGVEQELHQQEATRLHPLIIPPTILNPPQPTSNSMKSSTSQTAFARTLTRRDTPDLFHSPSTTTPSQSPGKAGDPEEYLMSPEGPITPRTEDEAIGFGTISISESERASIAASRSHDDSERVGSRKGSGSDDERGKKSGSVPPVSLLTALIQQHQQPLARSGSELSSPSSRRPSGAIVDKREPGSTNHTDSDERVAPAASAITPQVDDARSIGKKSVHPASNGGVTTVKSLPVSHYASDSGLEVVLEGEEEEVEQSEAEDEAEARIRNGRTILPVPMADGIHQSFNIDRAPSPPRRESVTKSILIKDPITLTAQSHGNVALLPPVSTASPGPAERSSAPGPSLPATSPARIALPPVSAPPTPAKPPRTSCIKFAEVPVPPSAALKSERLEALEERTAQGVNWDEIENNESDRVDETALSAMGAEGTMRPGGGPLTYATKMKVAKQTEDELEGGDDDEEPEDEDEDDEENQGSEEDESGLDDSESGYEEDSEPEESDGGHDGWRSRKDCDISGQADNRSSLAISPSVKAPGSLRVGASHLAHVALSAIGRNSDCLTRSRKRSPKFHLGQSFSDHSDDEDENVAPHPVKRDRRTADFAFARPTHYRRRRPIHTDSFDQVADLHLASPSSYVKIDPKERTHRGRGLVSIVDAAPPERVDRNICSRHSSPPPRASRSRTSSAGRDKSHRLGAPPAGQSPSALHLRLRTVCKERLEADDGVTALRQVNRPAAIRAASPTRDPAMNVPAKLDNQLSVPDWRSDDAAFDRPVSRPLTPSDSQSSSRRPSGFGPALVTRQIFRRASETLATLTRTGLLSPGPTRSTEGEAELTRAELSSALESDVDGQSRGVSAILDPTPAYAKRGTNSRITHSDAGSALQEMLKAT